MSKAWQRQSLTDWLLHFSVVMQKRSCHYSRVPRLGTVHSESPRPQGPSEAYIGAAASLEEAIATVSQNSLPCSVVDSQNH